LPEGSQLPSSRELARNLGVNRITVTNAYAELGAEGLVYTRMGSGTYVAASYQTRPEIISPDQWPIWQQKLSRQSRLPIPQESEDIGIVDSPSAETILFCGGIGSKELYPVDDFRKALQNVIRRDQSEAMIYGDPAGFLPLRETISHILSSQGIIAHPDDVLITSGSQQAIVLVASLIIRPGDTVLMESPTYLRAIDIFSSLGAHLVGVPVDDEGMRVEILEDLLRTTHPSLIYTIPTFQNPTGICLSNDRRRQLINLSERYNVPILEDEFVGELRYDGHLQPTLKTLDPGGMVMYIGTFSKMLMPALRIGYLVASGPIYDWLLERKHMVDLATSNLIQRALDDYITVGRYQNHLRRAKKEYHIRRDAMVDAIHRFMPEGVSWIIPKGGIFLWVKLPANISANDLYPIAIQQGVAYTPGSLFFPEEKEYSFLRLNFSIQPPQCIEDGICRLGKAIECFMNAGGK
jgi:GntR family transcriptional regulator/MocR family aminotransferase